MNIPCFQVKKFPKYVAIISATYWINWWSGRRQQLRSCVIINVLHRMRSVNQFNQREAWFISPFCLSVVWIYVCTHTSAVFWMKVETKCECKVRENSHWQLTQWLHCASFHMSIKFLTCHLKNSFLSCSENGAKQKQKHWAPYQTVWSELHCQDNLKKTWAQLLPQPQEGLTSRGLTYCPASDAALCVTASTCCGRRGGCWEISGRLRCYKANGKLCFTLLSFCLYSSYFCLPPAHVGEGWRTRTKHIRRSRSR